MFLHKIPNINMIEKLIKYETATTMTISRKTTKAKFISDSGRETKMMESVRQQLQATTDHPIKEVVHQPPTERKTSHKNQETDVRQGKGIEMLKTKTKNIHSALSVDNSYGSVRFGWMIGHKCTTILYN